MFLLKCFLLSLFIVELLIGFRLLVIVFWELKLNDLKAALKTGIQTGHPIGSSSPNPSNTNTASFPAQIKLNNPKKPRKLKPLYKRLLLITVLFFTLALVVNIVNYAVYLLTEKVYEQYMNYGDIFWVLGRFSMTWLFVGRLYYTFNGTALTMKKWKYYSVIIFGALGLIMYISSSILSKINNGPSKSIILVIFGVLYIIIDLIINVSIAVVFVKKLQILCNNSVKQDKQCMFKPLMNKFLYLILIAIYSTIIATVLGGLFIFIAFPIPSFFMVYPGVGLDCIINSYVLYYSMGFTKTKYNKQCIRFEKFCLQFCCCCEY